MWIVVIVAVVAVVVCVAAFVRGASALNAEERGLFGADTHQHEAEHRDVA